LGLSFEASQPLTLGLSGFGGASVHIQPILRWKKTMAPEDVRTWVTGFSRSGSFRQGARDLPRRPERLFVQPEKASAVIGSLLNPSTHQNLWARHSAYTLPTWRTSLQFSTPKGYGF
jgi:hypothetical protein